jgi:hypothetical protein
MLPQAPLKRFCSHRLGLGDLTCAHARWLIPMAMGTPTALEVSKDATL